MVDHGARDQPHGGGQLGGASGRLVGGLGLFCGGLFGVVVLVEDTFRAKGELYAAGGALNPLLRDLIASVAAGAPVTLRAGHDAGGGHEDWTGQSDHASFHEKHVPWVYFGVEDHADYHKPGDIPSRAMPGFFYGAARTVAEFVRRLDATPEGGR